MAASFWEKGSVPANLTRFLKSAAGVSVSRREDHIVGPLFSGGLSPAGRFLGEYSRLERGMGLDRDLRNGTLPPGEKRGRSVVTGPPAPICDLGRIQPFPADYLC